jgi:hypothetical protein
MVPSILQSNFKDGYGPCYTFCTAGATLSIFQVKVTWSSQKSLL